ncbi:MAG TPA: hypothetical protein VGC15_14785 [Acetobacteraceae bacterium]
MTDSSPIESAARLEAALERIARLAAKPPAPPASATDPALAARLDSLILQLREALDEEEPAHGPGQP